MQQQIDQNQVQHFTRAQVNHGGRQSQTYRSMVGDSGSTGLVMSNAQPNHATFNNQRNSLAMQKLQAQQRERQSSLGQNEDMLPEPQRSSMENMGIEQQQAQPTQSDIQNLAYANAIKQQQYFQSMNKNQNYINMAALNNQQNINAQFDQNMNYNQNQEQMIQNQVNQQAYNAQLMRQHQQTKVQPSQSRSQRVSVGNINTGPNNSAMMRNSNNLQNYNAQNNLQIPVQAPQETDRRKSKDAIESYRAVQEAMSRQQAHQLGGANSFNKSNQSRDGSTGPAPGIKSNTGGDHSSGGSVSSATRSGSRSRANGRISSSKNILSMIKCPCEPNIQNEQQAKRNLIRAHRGMKQPILMSSDNTANCGMCGQFYAIKDSQQTTNARNQVMTQQCRIIKTVREKGTIFKLDDSVYELLNRMRQVSNKMLASMNPHPCYLEKRVKRIDNLSFIADTLQTDNQTIHHAVHLMDIYSSKMPKNQEYDTLLISLIALFISTKYLQIKYPGADTLNDLAKRKYSADIIINMEGVFLDIIDWNLMVFPIYDYVRLFVSQGCLFEHEDILRPTNDDVLDDSDIRDKPSIQLAEHFKKYAEFFADFCLYQECFMTVDPYLLACAIVAYTRKYMGVAIIWPVELEMLTKCTLHHFRDLYLIIDSKYTENFPKHAKSQNYSAQILTEPQATVHQSIRKNQLMSSSSGGKTQKTQNSSVKPATSINNLNINNLLGDLKTPDKCVFDFNSNVSGNKTLDKFSHQKFQMNSNSVEKFRLQAKNGKNSIKISSENQVKAQGMIFSDNKKQATQNSLNKESGNKNNTVTKMILKNNFNNLSDEKSINKPKNYLRQKAADPNGYSSQKSQGYNATQNISEVVNSVNSPSANINENDNEQEVPPFKPMIIKSNSQAIGGNYECKTTTKKSPKGPALDHINAIKEAMNAANIEAKLPSSTTNKSGKLQINNSFANAAINSGMKSYGNINSNGVSMGPIKINQKIKLVGSSNKKSSGQKSSRTGADGSSTKKIKISKSYAGQMQGIQQNLNNNFYQEKLAEQRNERAHQAIKNPAERMSSVASTGQTRSNPVAKQQSYISGKPKAQADFYRQQALNAQNQPEAPSSHYGQNNRSILSIKNAAQVIKRKNSFQNQSIDLKVNINKQQTGPPAHVKQPEIIQKEATSATFGHQLVPNNMVRTKNMPNGLLRRATGGNQGTQKSIGALSNYNGRGPNARNSGNSHQLIQKSNERNQSAEGFYFNNDSKMQKDGLTPRAREQLPVKQVAAPAIMSNSNSIQGSMVKNKSFGAHQSNQLMGKVHNSVEKEGNYSQSNLHAHHHSTQFRNYISQPNSNQKNYQTQDHEEGKNPIKQMIKSGSQVLGKARQRPQMTRSQMLKNLNQKNDKISHLVEAAHATRCVSNEKTSSTKKPNVSEISARPQVQSFTQKYSAQYNDGPISQVTNFEQVIQNNSHSEERAAKYQNHISGDQDENINAINIQQNNVQKKGNTSKQNTSQGQNEHPQPQRYAFQFN